MKVQNKWSNGPALFWAPPALARTLFIAPGFMTGKGPALIKAYL